MTKEQQKNMYIAFMEDLLEIGLENIENEHSFNDPYEQLMDSLEELGQIIDEFEREE